MLSGSLGVCGINGELILPGEKYLINQFGLRNSGARGSLGALRPLGSVLRHCITLLLLLVEQIWASLTHAEGLARLPSSLKAQQTSTSLPLPVYRDSLHPWMKPKPPSGKPTTLHFSDHSP